MADGHKAKSALPGGAFPESRRFHRPWARHPRREDGRHIGQCLRKRGRKVPASTTTTGCAPRPAAAKNWRLVEVCSIKLQTG